MGSSYHDEQSMVETAASWRFVSYNQNPGSESGDIENVGQERLDPIGIQQQSDNIEIVDRWPTQLSRCTNSTHEIVVCIQLHSISKKTDPVRW